MAGTGGGAAGIGPLRGYCRLLTSETARPTGFIPHLYYAAPMGGRDILGSPVRSFLLVNTTDVFDRQMEMLACHKSQREWLLAHLGMDNYLEFLPQRSEEQGREAGVAFAEGFRQHLGSGFPQDGELSNILRELVIPNRKAQTQT